jgi:uncharacterized protein
MIISFSLENWMSFRDRVTFSMTASKERQHGERIPKLGKYQTRVLPIAAIYGGNASGKTNLFRALNFAKTLVTQGTQPEGVIPVVPFLLDGRGSGQSSCFSFELLIDETIYEYSFTVTYKEVLEERLVKITSTSESTLFDRRGGKLRFAPELEDLPFLHFAFQGTRDNQLFLTNSVSQKVATFRPVFDWFRNTLELIAPDSRFELFEKFLDEDHPLYATMNAMLPQLDTSIAHLGSEEIPFENLPLTEPEKAKVREMVQEGRTVRLLAQPLNERFVVTRKRDKLTAKKLMSYHPKADGSEAKFEIRQESDGSQRVIDLLPAFLELSVQASKKVYIIDEVDRSLHTLLTRRLLEAYLDSCGPLSRAQMLFTTHDVLLMDQHLFRRDEMWVTERDVSGASILIPFSDYRDVRYDKDIRKSYLQGRLGGIPRLLLGGRPERNEPEGGRDG